MSLPSGRPQTRPLPDYAAPLSFSVMVLSVAYTLAPEHTTRCFLQLLALLSFFFSGQAV
jgi:hypothetical protein